MGKSEIYLLLLFTQLAFAQIDVHPNHSNPWKVKENVIENRLRFHRQSQTNAEACVLLFEKDSLSKKPSLTFEIDNAAIQSDSITISFARTISEKYRCEIGINQKSSGRVSS